MVVQKKKRDDQLGLGRVVVMLGVVLVGMAWTASAEIVPLPKHYRLPTPNKDQLRWATWPDPPSNPYVVQEPTDERERVYRCWGYVARGKAAGELNQYFVNRTAAPLSSNTCEGVNRLHNSCWRVMFNIFWQSTPRRVAHLRYYCLRNAPPAPPDHFNPQQLESSPLSHQAAAAAAALSP